MPQPLATSRSSGSRSFPTARSKQSHTATAGSRSRKHSIAIVRMPSAIVGYARPESMAAARWASRQGVPSILMSESQQIDRPHVWWKELIKKQRVAWFDAALVGGPTHRDYLVQLGMPPERIALGYNAVDNDYFATAASSGARPTTAARACRAFPTFSPSAVSFPRRTWSA